MVGSPKPERRVSRSPSPRTEDLLSSTVETAVAIRPFHVEIPDEALDDDLPPPHKRLN